jgi:tetratricopeptide (TPR) repeat protein
LYFALGAAVVAAGSAAGYAAWSSHRRAREVRRAPNTSTRPDRASFLENQKARVRENARAKAAAADWVDREVAALEGAGDGVRLTFLFERSAHGFAPRGPTEQAPWREAAALRVGNTLLAMGRPHELDTLRGPWLGREARPADWLALDADERLWAGQRDEARRLLEGALFAGPGEGRRLARVAVLAARDDPRRAPDLLARAEKEAPKDLDLLSQKARALEELGRADEARAAFEAAAAAVPGDVFLRNQLAEFHRRRGEYRAALAAWLGDPSAPPPDFVWLKAWFWSRVAQPVAFDWRAAAPAEGRARALATFLVNMEPGVFWRNDLRLSTSAAPLAGSQEVYWLPLLGALQAGQERPDIQERQERAALQARQERAALEHMRDAGFRPGAWRPDVETALARVLHYRKRGRLPSAVGQGPPPAHPFFRQLENLAVRGELGRESDAVPADLKELLDGDEAFAAVFLAAGWREAACRFHQPDADLAKLPAWFRAEMARALRAAEADGPAD